eukprot:14411960-Ditylum_brightwellii.AAC.1
MDTATLFDVEEHPSPGINYGKNLDTPDKLSTDSPTQGFNRIQCTEVAICNTTLLPHWLT